MAKIHGEQNTLSALGKHLLISVQRITPCGRCAGPRMSANRNDCLRFDILRASLPLFQLVTALQVDAFRRQLEVGLPKLDAGVAARLNGVHGCVVPIPTSEQRWLRLACKIG